MRRLLIILSVVASLILFTRCGTSDYFAYPTFDIPPPEPSAQVMIPQNLLMVRDTATTLHDVANKLVQALDSAYFGDRRFYAPKYNHKITEGFVLVTQWEQIDEDGNPLTGPDRWAVNVTPPREWTLRSFIRALFGLNTGYFRTTLFFVTPYHIGQDATKITRQEALSWSSKGASFLPDDIGLELFYSENKQYYCTVYIYEFIQLTPDDYPVQRKRIDGGHPARVHLEKSQLWAALEIE